MGYEGSMSGVPADDGELIVGAKRNPDGSLDTSSAMKMVDPMPSESGLETEGLADWRQFYLDRADLTMAERQAVANLDPEKPVPRWLEEKLDVGLYKEELERRSGTK